jgi:hypothetical protein
MPGGAIFISYRREDAAGEAGRLSDHLARRFGEARVFIDIDTIAPGTDFIVELDRALADTKVLLVIIGRRWLDAADATGARRLDRADDFVRREIHSALSRGVRIVPVLVQGATMPSEADLPKPLAKLATRQAMAIQHEEFGADAQRLAAAIAPLLEEIEAPRWWQSRVLVPAVLAAIVLAALAGWWWQRVAADTAASARATTERESVRRARQADIDGLLRVAAAQRERGELSEALRTLDQATVIAADATAARTLQQDVAMESIRELAVGEGERFADALKRPVAILDQAAPFATGTRQGDLLAHLGWATFLRWREGERQLRPDDVYRKALAADPKNPFANAMRAHWLLWRDRAEALTEARGLFRQAAEAGREREFVRGLQLAALKNTRSLDAQLEQIRVIDEMRRSGDVLPETAVRDIWANYYFALGDRGELTWMALAAVLPPTEHLLTFEWAFADYGRADGSRRQQYRYYVARLQAAAGRSNEARAALQVLRGELAASPGTLRDAVDAAIRDLPR